MCKLVVIGVDGDTLSPETRDILAGCSHVFATPRLQKLISDFPVEIHNISPVADAIAEIGKIHKLKTPDDSNRVAVLAGGDPLFYGIGKTLLVEFGAAFLEFYPAVSSIQQACALFKTPWNDATILSLHGRENPHIPGFVLRHSKCILLTDRKNSPDSICRDILSYLQLIGDEEKTPKITVMVAENIGMADQRIFSGKLIDVAGREFSPLNVLLITTPATAKESFPVAFGLTEDEIIHSRGLITKNEVRAATIHQLRLPQTGVLWDVGAGSGSISIEAARSHPDLTIFAIEHKKEEIDNIKANIRKFGCCNIIPIFGKAPEALLDLPQPDRIFIGGSSGTLPALIKMADRLLSAGGRIVINGVTEKTITEAPKILAANGFTTTSTTLSVTRMGSKKQTVTFNPITITAGSR